MAEIHQHLPTPDDIRTILYVSEEGRLIRVGPELYPRVLCLLPDCHLNRRNHQSQEGEAAATPAAALPESQDGRGDTTSITGMRIFVLSFLLFTFQFLPTLLLRPRLQHYELH